MKPNFIHVCFIIDKSGSMWSSASDVQGGVASTIRKQKETNVGQCAISMYTFNDYPHKEFIGKDINEISEHIDYFPNGMTAMYDGIGTAIKDIGKWLNDMPEEERPSKNLIVIMTDGMENASKEYTGKMVKDMIKEQTEKYSWEFMYLGTDVTTTKDADELEIKMRGFTSRDTYSKSYEIINKATTCYRVSGDSQELSRGLSASLNDLSEEYNASTGLNLS